VETFLDLVRSVNAFVVAGMGGLTSAFPGYAVMVLDTLALAQACGVRTVLLGQGLGPLDSNLEELSQRVLRQVDYIALREGLHGPSLLRKWGLKDEQWSVTGDDAVELAFQNRPGTVGHAIGINLRIADYSGMTSDVIDELRAPLHEVARTLRAPLRVIPISRLPEEDDASCARALIAGYPDVEPFHTVPDDPVAVIREIQQCRIVVTGSYHAGVFALAQGIPVVGLVASDYYQWKFEGLAWQFGEGCCILRLETSTDLVELRRMVCHLWLNAPRMQTELLLSAQQQQEAGTAAYAHVSRLVTSRSRERDRCVSR